jgi:hypothetical protein
MDEQMVYSGQPGDEDWTFHRKQVNNATHFDIYVSH